MLLNVKWVPKCDLRWSAPFSFFSFFSFGLVTRRENWILKHACIVSFLPSQCSFEVNTVFWSFGLLNSFYELQTRQDTSVEIFGGMACQFLFVFKRTVSKIGFQESFLAHSEIGEKSVLTRCCHFFQDCLLTAFKEKTNRDSRELKEGQKVSSCIFLFTPHLFWKQFFHQKMFGCYGVFLLEESHVVDRLSTRNKLIVFWKMEDTWHLSNH